MLTSVLLKRGGTASPEVVARTRVKRDSLKAIERDARKPAKAKPEDPKIRISRDLTNGRLDAALLLQRRARTWLRGRKKLRRKQRSRAAKLIQLAIRTCLLLRVAAKPCITSTTASSGSEGADGEELVELPEPASRPDLLRLTQPPPSAPSAWMATPSTQWSPAGTDAYAPAVSKRCPNAQCAGGQ